LQDHVRRQNGAIKTHLLPIPSRRNVGIRS
jgi:hypothetical protein